jgi:hypothetical protein
VENAGHAVDQKREDVKATRWSWFVDQRNFALDRVVRLNETTTAKLARR